MFSDLSEGLAVRGGGVAQQMAVCKVAETLMNKWDLWIAGKAHRIVELETYVHGPAHSDPYTHGDAGQGCCGVWYFHRQGKSFKSGTFKGLDLACGDDQSGVRAGLLLRSVQQLEAGSKLVEGPCLVVDLILRHSRKKSIADFTSGRAASELPADATEDLALKPAALPRSDQTWAAPRVGLVLRDDGAGKTHSHGKPSGFVARPYRFSTVPTSLGKFRIGFFIASYLQGADDATLVRLLPRSQLALLDKYKGAVDEGRTQKGALERYVNKKISVNQELCELAGACFAATAEA